MFVGRPAELAHVDELLAEATGGFGGVLWLTGDPGMGKSAFIDAAVRRARRRGLQAVLVRGIPLSEPVPFALADDLLRTLGGHPADGSGSSDVGAASTALVAGLVGWARVSPSLVTIDDLSSADEASVAAVIAAVSRTMDLPLVVVVTGRGPRPQAAPSDEAGAVYQGWPERRLGPLDPLAAAAVARAALGSDAAERTVAALVAARCGNPGAIRDTARLLTPDEVSGAVPLPDPLPMSASVSRGWTVVLDGLASDTREALGALAVIQSTRFDLISAVLTRVGCPLSALDEATDRGLVRRDSRGVPDFVQPLLRAAIVAGMTPAQYRVLNRTAAHAAASLHLPTGIVVRHLTASTTRPDAQVADALADQAQRARDQRDPYGAADAQVWAARLTPDPQLRRSRILHAVRDRADCINNPEAVEDLLALIGLDPVPAHLSAWVTELRASVEPDLAVAAAEQRLAIEEARTSAPELVPELLWDAAISGWALGQPQPAMDAVDEFERVVASAGQSWRRLPAWSGTALRSAGLFQLGEVAESATLRTRALSVADQLNAAHCDPDILMRAVDLDDLLLADTPGSQSRMSAALQRCASETPMTPCLWGMAAWQARARGDWVSAELLIHDGVALCHEMSAIWPLDGLLAVSVELASLQGDTERLVRHGRALRDLGIWSADRRRLAILDRATGMAALGAGSLDAAAASLGQAADVPFLGRGLRDAVIPSRVDLIEVLHRLDRLDEAAERAEALHRILRAMDQPLAQAWDQRVSALVSHGEDVDAHYEAALIAHAQDADPFEAGRTELLYGEHLRRTQRRSQARAHLSQAETLFTHMQATPWLDRTRQELRVSGTPRQPSSWTTPALTGQEANIATAVAQGRSTREVAQMFVLSPRTVETHLSSVYRKLGVTGRAGLAQRLSEHRGLITK
jgi:DNA-binding CsgD family transcriptional regulator/tetratricopeptide (TPR) repeat protein